MIFKELEEGCWNELGKTLDVLEGTIVGNVEGSE